VWQSNSERVYNNNTPHGIQFPPSTNIYAKYEFTSLRDAGGTLTKTAIKEYNYDKNGNVTQVKEYDWVSYSSVPRDGNNRPTGLPAGATPTRVTVNTYYSPTPDASDSTTFDADTYSKATSPRLRNALESSEVRNSGGTAMSRTEAFYDNATTTGNLTTQKSWDSTKGAISRPLSGTNSISVSTQYSSTGNPTLITDAKGNQTQMTYGGVGSFTDLYPTQIIAAYGQGVARTSTKQYDFYSGLETRVTDADNNVAAATTYDVFGRPTLVKAAEGKAEETRTATSYNDAARRMITSSDLNSLGDGKLVSVKHYDQLGRIRLSRQLEDASTQSATDETTGIKVQMRYKYSNPNSYTVTSNPYRAASSGAAGSETTMGWSRSKADSGGRLIETESFSGASLPFPWGSNTSSTGIVYTAYDANSTTVQDQASKQRRSLIDGLGRLVRVDEPTTSGLGNISSPNQPTSYSYDVLDNLTQVAQGTQTRTFVYDSLKRLTSATNPENGTMNYTYDNNSNLKTKQDARSITTTYTYDALNRVTFKDYSDTTPDVSYSYDPAITYGKGKLSQVSNGISTTEYLQFDALGRIKQSKQTTVVNSTNYAYTMSYAYNLAGGMTSETYPSNRVVLTEYDAAGRIAGVQNQATSLYYVGATSTDATNRLQYTSHGAVSVMKLGNSKWEHTNFNTRLQPTQIGLGTSSTNSSLLQLDYTYGTTTNNGNVLTQRILVSLLDVTQFYTYDEVNRLKTAEEKQTSTQTQIWKQAFTFDRYGNRNFDVANTTANVLGANPTINQSNNRFNIGQSYSYDVAGNVTQEPSAPTNKGYTYDAENHQLTFTFNSQTTNYSYDGEGRRVKKANPDGTTIVYVYNAIGEMLAEYSTGSPSGTGTSYFTQDHLGSTRVLTKSDGTVRARYDFLPFGEDISASIGNRNNAGYLTDTTKQKFTGHERDQESGLDFAQARYCSSGTGRFMSPDEPFLSQYEDDPQSWNLYVYARNNPIIYVDPTGNNYFLVDDKGRILILKDWNGNNPDFEFISGDGKNIVLKDKEGTEWSGFYYEATEDENRQTDWDYSIFDVVDHLRRVADLARMPFLNHLHDGDRWDDPAKSTINNKFSKSNNPSGSGLSPYEIAKAGGKHSGFLRNYLTRTKAQIEKAIRSIEKQIAAHTEWIADPTKHVKDWSTLDPREQYSLVNKKWPGDIQRQTEQIEILKGLLKTK